MFELKEGMKVKIKYSNKIYTFCIGYVEKFTCTDEKYVNFNIPYSDVDWEETAELNEIDFSKESLKYLEKRNNDLNDKFYNSFNKKDKQYNPEYEKIERNVKEQNEKVKIAKEEMKKQFNPEYEKIEVGDTVEILQNIFNDVDSFSNKKGIVIEVFGKKLYVKTEENPPRFNYFSLEHLKKIKKDTYENIMEEFLKLHNKMLNGETLTEEEFEKYNELGETTIKKEELGRKENKGKIRPSLLPITELKEVIRVFEYGVEKYSINNWKHVKDPVNEYSNALYRHLLDYLEGEKKASDSNLSHLAHICANALILMWFENNKEE